MKWILLGCLGVILVVGIIAYFIYSNRNVYEIDSEDKQILYQAPVSEADEYKLLAQVSSEEEAKEIADLYGITLLDYLNGVARYHTDEDPTELIEMGKKKGYPLLSISQEMKIFEEEGENE